jgi:hypothetical protein
MRGIFTPGNAKTRMVGFGHGMKSSRKLFNICLLSLLLLTSCQTHTQYGECIGLADIRDPKTVYRVSIWNAFLAIIFVETVIAPVYIVGKRIECPAAKRAEE